MFPVERHGYLSLTLAPCGQPVKWSLSRRPLPPKSETKEALSREGYQNTENKFVEDIPEREYAANFHSLPPDDERGVVMLGKINRNRGLQQDKDESNERKYEVPESGSMLSVYNDTSMKIVSNESISDMNRAIDLKLDQNSISNTRNETAASNTERASESGNIRDTSIKKRRLIDKQIVHRRQKLFDLPDGKYEQNESIKNILSDEYRGTDKGIYSLNNLAYDIDKSDFFLNELHRELYKRDEIIRKREKRNVPAKTVCNIISFSNDEEIWFSDPVNKNWQNGKYIDASQINPSDRAGLAQNSTNCTFQSFQIIRRSGTDRFYRNINIKLYLGKININDHSYMRNNQTRIKLDKNSSTLALSRTNLLSPSYEILSVNSEMNRIENQTEVLSIFPTPPKKIDDDIVAFPNWKISNDHVRYRKTVEVLQPTNIVQPEESKGQKKSTDKFYHHRKKLDLVQDNSNTHNIRRKRSTFLSIRDVIKSIWHRPKLSTKGDTDLNDLNDNNQQSNLPELRRQTIWGHETTEDHMDSGVGDKVWIFQRFNATPGIYVITVSMLPVSEPIIIIYESYIYTFCRPDCFECSYIFFS